MVFIENWIELLQTLVLGIKNDFLLNIYDYLFYFFDDINLLIYLLKISIMDLSIS